MTEKTIGQNLNELRRRARMSLVEVAKAAGYSGASSVQTYFREDYDPVALDSAVGTRLARALAGKGEPPIQHAEIFYMPQGLPTGLEHHQPKEVTPPLPDTPTLRGQPKDVPVYGTALASDLIFDPDTGERHPIEQTTFDMGEVLGYVRRPPGIDQGRKVYVVYVVGHSMEPRYRPGDPVFVDPTRPPSIGDDVIVQLAEPDIDGGVRIVGGLIKTLARRSASAIELEQYAPATRFRVAAPQIASVHRIIPWREAFGM